ncbi:MAG: beta-ureidopropionase [Candidatus Krumholzibacteria bacterium]|nr:beta-ureidopropionase [Candidatus Krumholzibacteria bacterium]
MRIGFLQLRPRFGAVKENVRKAIALLDQLSDATVVLPELFNTGYLFRNEEELSSLAETIPGGYTVSEMQKLAKKRQLNIVFGMAQRYKGAYYNSAVCVTSKGKIEVYQKVHLFDREKLFFTRGKSFKIVSTEQAKLGLLVCFDWIFPEAARTLALGGAQILCHPSNLVLPYAKDAMKTRCIENRVFGVTANRIGSERRGTMFLSFTGGSQIVNPAGDVLASASDRSESLRVVEIDVGEALDKNITTNNNLFEDRTPSLYKALVRKRR